MTTITNQHGAKLDFDAVVNLMDDDVRLGVHAVLPDDVTNQRFFDLYCFAHKDEFDEEFYLNSTVNPIW